METWNFKTRYHVMDISSIEAFMNVKGGYGNGCKDVYFLRIVGINEGMLREIEAMDRTLALQMENGRGFYHRHNSLPRLTAMTDVDFYSGCYENWVSSGKQRASIKATGQNQQLCSILGTACQEVLGLLEKGKPGMNQSIGKNFMVKVLFWLDQTVSAALQKWEPEKSMKAVFVDICKQQEYLFCYLLTRLGFDVLLLQTKHDIPPELERLGLSRRHTAANPGQYVVPEYMPEKHLNPENPVVERRDALVNRTPRVAVNVRVPERDRRTEEMLHLRSNRETEGRQNNAGSSRGTEGGQNNVGSREMMGRQNAPGKSELTARQNAPGGKEAAERQNASNGRRELTYEELAMLASSVVQIMIHDNRGDIIGGGSGIMIGRAGYILTNNHVACRGRRYSVRIEEDEKVYQTDEMIKYNSVLDLAVIRIDRKLQPLPIYKGDKKLVRGQRVVAIGSPLGLFNSVSDGIISGFRVIEDVDMIQFTAPISSGSSGGAVLNMYGEVIGISTAGFDHGQNINLAVGYEYIGNFVRGFVD